MYIKKSIPLYLFTLIFLFKIDSNSGELSPVIQGLKKISNEIMFKDKESQQINSKESLTSLASDSKKEGIQISNLKSNFLNLCNQLGDLERKIITIDPKSISEKELILNGSNLIQTLFESRLALREGLVQLNPSESSKNSFCIKEIRSFFRTSRYIEEYISEKMIRSKIIPEGSKKVLLGSAPSLMINPKIKIENSNPSNVGQILKSGDVLLSRGNAVVSAAIARIGDDDGQFSHVALIYIDGNQKIYAIEAHIEIGAVVSPIEKYLNDGKVRSVIYRHSNAELAHRAAQIMYEKVKAHNYPYDFGMDMSNEDELFCSEVASLGYKLASDELHLGSLEIPLFKTVMTMKNRRFLDDIGVKVRETFAPTDIDLDHRFELIAEWRDLSSTEDARFLDSILTKIYFWMEPPYNYVFDSNYLLEEPLFPALWLGRRIPLFNELLKDSFPKNMGPKTLRLMFALGNVGDALLKKVKSANLDYLKGVNHKGWGMTFPQVKDLLEKERTNDYRQWKTEPWKNLLSDEPPFHNYFHSIADESF